METITDLAEQAWALAREVSHVASPAVQRSAESLARALERAADSKIAKAGEQQAAEVALVARERLADASERFAVAIRPKKEHHRVRNTMIGLVAVGAVAALVGSPLRSKLTERLFGPPPEDEPESITLPGADMSTHAEHSDAPQSPTTPATEHGNGVPSATVAGVDNAPA
ncbi:MAG: hypothetical protein JOZ75_11790 [Candidatus Dormibacteraeota bacterium]|nr:hypothetical protein [Candidatus Dormibacteraeota bacterium]